MAEIYLAKRLETPIETVFEGLSDHAGYIRFRGFTTAELVRDGELERNGVGALRKLAAGPLRFIEEITVFERPTRMDYVIREVSIPLEHEGGTILLSAAGGATEIRWRSTFTMPLPVIGAPLADLTAAVLKRGFSRLLDDIERLAAAGAIGDDRSPRQGQTT